MVGTKKVGSEPPTQCCCVGLDNTWRDSRGSVNSSVLAEIRSPYARSDLERSVRGWSDRRLCLLRGRPTPLAASPHRATTLGTADRASESGADEHAALCCCCLSTVGFDSEVHRLDPSIHSAGRCAAAAASRADGRRRSCTREPARSALRLAIMGPRPRLMSAPRLSTIRLSTTAVQEPDQ